MPAYSLFIGTSVLKTDWCLTTLAEKKPSANGSLLYPVLIFMWRTYMPIPKPQSETKSFIHGAHSRSDWFRWVMFTTEDRQQTLKLSASFTDSENGNCIFFDYKITQMKNEIQTLFQQLDASSIFEAFSIGRQMPHSWFYKLSKVSRTFLYCRKDNTSPASVKNISLRSFVSARSAVYTGGNACFCAPAYIFEQNFCCMKVAGADGHAEPHHGTILRNIYRSHI